MSVSLHWHAGVIRHHAPGGVYGDPSDFSVDVCVHGGEAFLFNARGDFTREVRQEIKDALTALGVTRAKFERRNAGGPREFAVED